MASKQTVRSLENNDGVLILDNSIIHKTYGTLNEAINYHHDHGEGRVIKGMNLLTALVRYNDATIPVGFEMLIKDQLCIKTNKHVQEKMGRKSRYTLNQHARDPVKQTILNELKFAYILGGSWFSSKENSVGKSPTKVKRSQTNHVCLALLAYSKIEQLKVSTENNHYTIKRQLLIAANQASYLELQKLRAEIKMTS